MTALKTDRRSERTRKALLAAFIDLILKHGYESVSISDIVTRANIGRSTFYIHYSGKEDILKQSMALPSSFLANLVGGDVAPDDLVPILVHFREQRTLNKVFFSWPIRQIWVRSLEGQIDKRLQALSNRPGVHPVVPLALIASHLAETQIALIANWLTGRVSCRPEAIAAALSVSTNAAVSALLPGGR
jgi:AcrR family transcriptional regulator